MRMHINKEAVVLGTISVLFIALMGWLIWHRRSGFRGRPA